jgi:hypothetical protein
MNMTHIETPLDPIEAPRKALADKEQADRAVALLRTELPECFGRARVRAYGVPGIGQTRWIAGVHQLAADEVCAGSKFDDAIGRTRWPIELHDHGSGHRWHAFGEHHVQYIPPRSLISPEADNFIAAGRCRRRRHAALTSVGVVGPCIAMGAAATHALDLAGAGNVHPIDNAALHRRLHDNVERTD